MRPHKYEEVHFLLQVKFGWAAHLLFYSVYDFDGERNRARVAAQENSVLKMSLKEEKGKTERILKNGDIAIDDGATSPRPLFHAFLIRLL